MKEVPSMNIHEVCFCHLLTFLNAICVWLSKCSGRGKKGKKKRRAKKILLTSGKKIGPD